MIKVKLTENYTGFNIEGTFDDFCELYNGIYHFLGYEECSDILEEDMRLHVLGFLYDLRHAYQGSRYIKAVDNDLSDYQKEFYGIKKSVKQDIVYGFDYLVTDLILDVLLFRYFVNKNSKEVNDYNINYNVVNTFYSKVINSLSLILTPIQMKKINKLLIESVIRKDYFLRQWYLMINVDYIKMTKDKRKKELMHVLDYICNWQDYEEYLKLKKDVEESALEHNCKVTEIDFEEYPEEIVW